MFQEHVKLPKIGSTAAATATQVVIGHHFDGQLGNIYFFTESMLASTMESLARSATARFKDGNRLNADYDLTNLLPMDRATAALTPKMLSVLNPTRVAKGFALDVHGGRHARLGCRTFAWSLRSPRDVLVALGGVLCLLPLFPRLLIENDCDTEVQEDDFFVESTLQEYSGLGSSLAEVFNDDDCRLYLRSRTMEEVLIDAKNFDCEGCIGLLLSLIARCLSQHPLYMLDMIRQRAFEMIEYALVNIPDEIMYRENSSCVLALLNIQTAVAENPKLDQFFAKRLLCNYSIWAKASLELQQSVMSIILAAIRGQPETYIKSVGVEWLFEQVTFFFGVDADMSSVTTSAGPLPRSTSDPITMQLTMPPKLGQRTHSTTPSFEDSSASADSYSDAPPILQHRRSVDELPPKQEHLRSECSNISYSTPSTPKSIARGTMPAPLSSYKSFNLALVRQISANAEYDNDSVSTDRVRHEGRRNSRIVAMAHKCRQLALVSHRARMRTSLYSAIHILVEHGLSVKELTPFFEFVDSCTDSVVRNEVSQLLLRLLVDNQATVPALMFESCGGLDGLASFILHNLIDNELEDIRCCGIRMLTYFYRRLDSLQMLAGPISRRLSKDNIIYTAMRTMTKVPGIDVLGKRGGIAVLERILTNYVKDSTLQTYSALLEMLVSRPGSMTSTVPPEMSLKDNPSSFNDYRVPLFKLTQLPPEDNEIYLEPVVLPLFLHIAKDLNCLETLFFDLLLILKSSHLNRDAFIGYASWNPLLFTMISSLDIIEDQSLITLSTSDVSSLLTLFFNAEVTNINPAKIRSPNTPSPKNTNTALLFQYGIDMYTTLLVHCIENRGGIREIDRLVNLSIMADVNGRGIMQTVLSHVFNSMARIMRTKFKEIQRLAKSSLKREKSRAVDRIENMLLLLICVTSYLSDDMGPRFEGYRLSASQLPRWRTVENKTVGLEDVPSERQFDSARSSSPLTTRYSGDTLIVLDPCHNQEHGRTVLLLQAARLFDVLFWPGEGATPLRNVEMLKYHRSNRKAASNKASQYSTLLVNMLRTTVILLGDLFPFGDLAELNMKRAVALLHASQTVYPLKGPTGVDEWFMLIFSHACSTMASVREAMSPLFKHLGLETLLPDVMMDSNQEYPFEPKHHKTQMEIDEEAYVRILHEKSLTLYTEGYFNTEFGRRVFRTVRCLVDILIAMFENSFNVLADALDAGVMESLSLMMQAMKVVKGNEEDEDEFEVIAPELERSNSHNSSAGRRPSFGYSEAGLFSELSQLQRESGGTELSDDESLVSIQWSGSTEVTNGPPQSLIQDLNISSIIEIFKWLRDPFFYFNLFTEKGIIDAMDTLTNLEKDACSALFDNMRSISSINEHPKPSIADLKGELRPKWHDHQVRNQAIEFALGKTVALNWQKHLRNFEASWSPWSNNQISFNIPQKMLNHRDRLLRRRLFIQSNTPVNYDEFRYSAHRKDDAEPNDAASIASPQKHAWAKAALMSKLQNWGDEDAQVFEETSSIELDREPQSILGVEFAPDEREIYESEATLVELEHSVRGTVYLTNKNLYFYPRKIVDGSMIVNRGKALRTRFWVLECLQETFGRRHLLKNCGVELFFNDAQEVFLAFKSLKELQKFFYCLRRQYVPYLVSPPSLNPKVICEKSNWTELWRRRIISNFEYIIRLNTMAGRSFNDITQYPVFPWVIADYTSKVLDLTNPETYRDLKKPIGALKESRLAEIMERYNNFDDIDVPKFMYGSHYSSAGVVLQYMIRQEPFTRMAINMQGGKFDCPDRLFFSIGSTWSGINNSISDVKELIPELFFCPEILLDSNNLPLGELQDGSSVSDVVLPPWANNDPLVFVRYHREALESDYVSDNLHHWIDLIFGYKQKGEAAIQAHNLFFYLTYENSVDIDEITDTLAREAMLSQVANFGQTPSQLFEKPHPRRVPAKECLGPLCADPESTISVLVFTPNKQQGYLDSFGSVLSLRCCGERFVALHADMTLCYYKWSPIPDGVNPFQIKFDRAKRLPTAAMSVSAVSAGKQGASPSLTSHSDELHKGDFRLTGFTL